ncbi:YbaB/EbfC family nucleoid-associated protein [Micromonospora sp. NPDC005171]|uniref:YbaB/EbfC family nucleoid-associated protein n=1 Tax=Micromonospora sp. NPDC005171 TaxID=3156866 RepID=UPI0033A0DCBF
MSDALDDLAELEELRRQAEELSGRLAAGDRAAAESSAWDSHEVVRIGLGPDGRIDAVEVLPHWRRHMTTEQLGAAIVEAADEAARRRSEAWAYGVSQAATDDVDARLPEQPSPVPTPTDPVDESSINYARSLLYVLRDSFARLDDLERETERAALSSSTTTDADGRVRVSLNGEHLSGVNFDESWLRSAHAPQLGAAVTEAVRQAYADRANATPLRNSWPYNELDRMTGDPAQLLANLGLAPRQAPRSN